MKLGSDVLLEIVEIVRAGLIDGSDVSQKLRDLDLVADANAEKLVLSPEYVKGRSA